MKRRMLLEASKLVVKHRLVKPGEMDQTALMLGVGYLEEKAAGTTDLDFDAWLDQDVEDDDDPFGGTGGDGEDADPT